MSFRGPGVGALTLTVFAGGTLAGLSGRGSAAAALVLAVAGFVATRVARGRGRYEETRFGRAGPTATLATICFAIGAGHGRLARLQDNHRCAAVQIAGPIKAELLLLEPARPGQRAAARLLGARCGGVVTVQLSRRADPAAAGDRLQVQGHWRPRVSRVRPASGVLSIARAALLSSEPSPLARLKNWLGSAVERLYGPRTGMVEALVLGRRSGLDPERSRAFSRTGLAHLLSISGFHVGLIWMWLVLLFRLAIGRGRAVVGAAVGALGYVAFLGFPAPALRAVVLAIATAAEQGRQRRPATGSMLAVVALLLVAADPWAVGSLGAWFSVSALWGATAASRWAMGALGRGRARSMVAASVGATLATAPISAFAFGSVPLAGVALNLIAMPVTALAVPAVVASLVLAAVSFKLAAAFAGGGGVLLAVLEAVATKGAAPRWAAITVAPGWESAALGGLAAIFAIWVFGRRHSVREAGRRLLWCATVGGVVHSGAQFRWPADTGSRLTLHFLDVGQGDAALLETPRGSWVLIDAGPADDRRDAGRDVIVPFLRRHGIGRLEGVVLSHGHRDHYGGLAAVLDAVEVGRVFEPGLPVTDRGYRSLLDQLTDQGVDWIPVRRGAAWLVDGIEIGVLHPDTTWAGYGEDLNEDSAVLTIRSGPFLAIFPGDAGLPVEAAVLSARGGFCPRCGPPGLGAGVADLLKVGHHGSRGATGSAWLEFLRPKAAVVSVGFNRYGHPAPETLERLSSHGVALWRTDQDGMVRVDVDESTMQVRGSRRRAVFSLS